MKRSNNSNRTVEPDTIGERRKMAIRDTEFGLMLGALFLVFVAVVFVGGYFSGHNTVVAEASNTSFTLKGTLSLDTEIDGEMHRLICYRVTITDFLLVEDEEQAALIGADEKFTKLLQPDGSMAYHSTYYSQLDDQRGLKVIKEFMDCGVENSQLIAGFETPLYLEFIPSTGYDPGIFDSDIKDNVEIIKFD